MDDVYRTFRYPTTSVNSLANVRRPLRWSTFNILAACGERVSIYVFPPTSGNLSESDPQGHYDNKEQRSLEDAALY